MAASQTTIVSDQEPAQHSPPAISLLMSLPNEILKCIVTEVHLLHQPCGVVKLQEKPLTSIFRTCSQLRHMAYEKFLKVYQW